MKSLYSNLLLIRCLSLFSKQRNSGKSRLIESTLFNRIHKHSFWWLAVDSFWRSAEIRPFFINIPLYPWNESVDSFSQLDKKVDSGIFQLFILNTGSGQVKALPLHGYLENCCCPHSFCKWLWRHGSRVAKQLLYTDRSGAYLFTY